MKKEIVRLYKQRYLAKEIAEMVKCSRQYVYRVLKEKGLGTRVIKKKVINT